MKFCILLLFVAGNLFAQTKHRELFIFKDQSVEYTTYYYDDKIYGINDFYVFINQNENITKCFKNKHSRLYFINIPSIIPENKREELFLEYINHITSITKLVESNLNIIAEKDYATSYREIFDKKKRYKGSYLNAINGMHINKHNAEICKLLQ